jgi:NADH:ubiquinone reductase (H+-translocating)
MASDELETSCKGETGESAATADSKRVLILGGGFGGVYAALWLEKVLAARDGLEVTLITRENYFLFSRMLPEVAAGELEQNTIVNPLRKLLRRVKSFVGTIEEINLDVRHVLVSHGFDGQHELPYDQLILALGSGTSFFWSSRCRGGMPGAQDAQRRGCHSQSAHHSS